MRMLDLFWAIKPHVQQLGYATLFVLALARGAAPEKLLSGALLGMLVIDAIYHFSVHGSVYWHRADLGHAAIDTGMLFALCAVALHANRVYPLWIGGAQIIAVVAHLYRISLIRIDPFAYATMAVMPSYIQLVAMTAGLACHMSRHTKRGSYPSWRRFSRSMPAPMALRSHGA